MQASRTVGTARHGRPNRKSHIQAAAAAWIWNDKVPLCPPPAPRLDLALRLFAPLSSLRRLACRGDSVGVLPPAREHECSRDEALPTPRGSVIEVATMSDVGLNA